jgi:uncharacterized protein YneF (UPF0154 family)
MKTSIFEKISNSLFGEGKTHRGESVKVILTIVTIVLTLAAGIVALFVLFSTIESVKEMKEQTKRTDEQIQIMYKGNTDARFNNAVEHLGCENSAVVLGGIHTLHQIAVEDTTYSQIVHNIFCSYLRENSAKLYAKPEFKENPEKSPVVIQILLDYLFRPYNNKDCVYKDYVSDLSFSTLKNYVFNDINVENVNFDYCILENCDFVRGKLIDCNFGRATLRDCVFSDVILHQCYFGNGWLVRCEFIETELTNCYFNCTHFSYNPGYIAGAILMECYFSSGKLTDCSFKEDGGIDAIFFDCKFNDNVELINTKLPENRKGWMPDIKRKILRIVP